MPLLLALFLALLLPTWVSAKQPTKRPTDERRGETLFQQNCWQCHGKRGKGKGPLAAALGGPLAPVAQRFTTDEYNAQIKVILQGRGDMPGFDQVMNRADARRILIWLEDARISKRAKKKPKHKRGKRSRPGRRGTVKPEILKKGGGGNGEEGEVEGDEAGGGNEEAGGGNEEAGGGNEEAGGGNEEAGGGNEED